MAQKREFDTIQSVSCRAPTLFCPSHKVWNRGYIFLICKGFEGPYSLEVYSELTYSLVFSHKNLDAKKEAETSNVDPKRKDNDPGTIKSTFVCFTKHAKCKAPSIFRTVHCGSSIVLVITSIHYVYLGMSLSIHVRGWCYPTSVISIFSQLKIF